MTYDDSALIQPRAADGEPSAADVTRLAGLLAAHIPYDGRFELRIPGVYAIRAARPSAEPLHTLV
jgi:hypothetical protein